MKNCDGCGRSPELCCCQKLEVEHRYCTLCTAERPRHELLIVDDERGFFAAWKCKDIKACAKYMATVAWAKVSAESR